MILPKLLHVLEPYCQELYPSLVCPILAQREREVQSTGSCHLESASHQRVIHVPRYDDRVVDVGHTIDLRNAAAKSSANASIDE
jgi:hypothetical protein